MGTCKTWKTKWKPTTRFPILMYESPWKTFFIWKPDSMSLVPVKFLQMNVVISKGVPQPQDLQNRIFYDLVMIMTWYLGWGDFRAWQTFSKFLVNRCWLIFDIWCLICQNRPKNAKKGNCWLKSRGVSVISCLQPWYLGEKWPKGYRTT